MIKALLLSFLKLYQLLLIVRILLTWLPDLHNTRFYKFLCSMADPYLRPFSRIVPPIAGTIDISPIFAYYLLSLGEHLVIRYL